MIYTLLFLSIGALPQSTLEAPRLPQSTLVTKAEPPKIVYQRFVPAVRAPTRAADCPT